jgi:hypothetical protein
MRKTENARGNGTDAYLKVETSDSAGTRLNAKTNTSARPKETRRKTSSINSAYMKDYV